MSAKNRVIVLALITAIAVTGDAMLFIVLPVYWHDFGLTALWQIGLLLSINRFIRLPINPLVGFFYKHFQIRTGFFIAIVLATITTFSYGIFHHFWFLLIARALWGVAWSLLRLGGFFTIIEVSDDLNRGRFIGLYNGLWGIGGLFGMLAGGLLVDQTSILFVTTLFGFLGLFSIPFVWFLIPATKVTKKNDDNEESQQSESKTKFFSTYTIMVLTTGLAMGFVIFGVIASTLSPLIQHTYTEDLILFQITIGAATLAGLIQGIRWGWDPFVAPFIGRIFDASHSKIKILLIPIFGGGLLLFVLPNLQSIISLIIGLLLFQIISTIFITATDTIATNLASQTNRIKMVTLHTITVDVGAALGPLISFFIIEHYSISITYYFTAGFLILLGFAWSLLKFKQPLH